jgi:hypothetical protein
MQGLVPLTGKQLSLLRSVIFFKNFTVEIREIVREVNGVPKVREVNGVPKVREVNGQWSMVNGQ